MRSLRVLLYVFIVDQYALRCAFQIIKLPAPHRPEKCCKAQQAKPQSNGYQDKKAAHLAAAAPARPALASRSELPTTT
jgi:hypothetical protein